MLPSRSRSVSCDGLDLHDAPAVEDQRVRDVLDRHVDRRVRPGAGGSRGNGGGAPPPPPGRCRRTPAGRGQRAWWRASACFGLSPARGQSGGCRVRKGDVKRAGRRLSPAARFVLLKPSRLRSVGQLAPQPDLTRQCAFDLRSRLEILSTGSDGARFASPAEGGRARGGGFRAGGPASCLTLLGAGAVLPWSHGSPFGGREIWLLVPPFQVVRVSASRPALPRSRTTCLSLSWRSASARPSCARSTRSTSTARSRSRQLVLPDALAGLDILAESPTGSGKTLAFGLPLVERTVERERPARRRSSSSRRVSSRPGRSRPAAARRGEGPARRDRLRRRPARPPGEAGPRRAHPRRDTRPAARPARAAA